MPEDPTRENQDRKCVTLATHSVRPPDLLAQRPQDAACHRLMRATTSTPSLRLPIGLFRFVGKAWLRLLRFPLKLGLAS